MGQSRIFQMLPGFGVLSCHATKNDKKDAKYNSWLKKKEDRPKKKLKKKPLENHDSILTKITTSKKMS